MSITSKPKDDKPFRNWWFMLYPESASSDWKEVLEHTCTPVFISPLHDSDVDPGGELKKPHYHIMIMFEGKKSLKQIHDIIDPIGGVMLEVVLSLRGAARYLCHLDNPEKYQYDVNSVTTLGYMDYLTQINLVSDKYKTVAEMQDFCCRYQISSFYVLSMYAKENEMSWFRTLVDHSTIFMREWLKSKAWSDSQNQSSIVDPLTGEVIFDIVTTEQG